MIKLLLNYHANPLLINNQGRTPIDIAKYHENNSLISKPEKISNILLEYSSIVKEKYNKLIKQILIKTKQEVILNDIIFDFIF